MNRLFLALAVVIVGLNASAAKKNIETICQEKATEKLAAVAAALGMGKGVGHLGGSVLGRSDQDVNNNTVMTFVGGPLAASDADSYISGSGAIVKVVVTGESTCKVENIDITTGASFQKTVKDAVQK